MSLPRDLRYALRALRRSPGFAFAAVLVLALGIGANTAIFTVVDAVLLQPLPYAEPGRLVRLYERLGGNPYNVASGPNFLDWQREATSYLQMAAYGDQGFNLSGILRRLASCFTSPITGKAPVPVPITSCRHLHGIFSRWTAAYVRSISPSKRNRHWEDRFLTFAEWAHSCSHFYVHPRGSGPRRFGCATMNLTSQELGAGTGHG